MQDMRLSPIQDQHSGTQYLTLQIALGERGDGCTSVCSPVALSLASVKLGMTSLVGDVLSQLGWSEGMHSTEPQQSGEGWASQRPPQTQGNMLHKTIKEYGGITPAHFITGNQAFAVKTAPSPNSPDYQRR